MNVVKKLLRPIFNKLASSVGVVQVQQRVDVLEHVVHEPPLNAAHFDLLERRIVDLAMARTASIMNDLAETNSALKQAITDTEERLTHLNAVTRGDIENRLISLNQALVSYVDTKQDLNLDAFAAHEESQSEIVAAMRFQVRALASKTLR